MEHYQNPVTSVPLDALSKPLTLSDYCAMQSAGSVMRGSQTQEVWVRPRATRLVGTVWTVLQEGRRERLTDPGCSLRGGGRCLVQLLAGRRP